MSEHDSLKDVREVLGSPQPGADLEPEQFSQHHFVGSHITFKTERLEAYNLGNNDLPEAIMLETLDLRNNDCVRARHIVFTPDVIPGLLRTFIQAEVQEANINTAQAESRPELPITVGEVVAAIGSSVRVSLDERNGYIDVKISKILRGRGSVRSGQWAKFSAGDIRPVGRLLLAAYDAINGTPDAGPTETSAQDDIGF